VQDKVDVPPAGRGTLLGLSVQPVSPAGGDIEETESATEPVEVLPAFTLIVDVPEAPARTFTELGLDVRKKSEDESTATETVAVRSAPTAMALAVTVNVPVAVCEVTVKFTFLLAPAARVKVVWLKAAVGPPVTSGDTTALMDTEPDIPPMLVTVTMEDAAVKLVPVIIVNEVGLADTAKFTT
jgi:hypothetical protein